MLEGRLATVENKVGAMPATPDYIKDIIRQCLLEIIAEAKVSHDLSTAEITLEDFESILHGTYQYQ